MRTFTIVCSWMLVGLAGCGPVTDGVRQDLPRRRTRSRLCGETMECRGHGDDLAAETRVVYS